MQGLKGIRNRQQAKAIDTLVAGSEAQCDRPSVSKASAIADNYKRSPFLL
ncbi:MAG: hypothetical protein RMY62_001900 [Nostoc sp. ZfuVER08]|uniref:Uncharacterized protein n=1 Tax=Nostoc punctiforme FACHB-252 TaxID=1357509 RepID=A0ABR8HB93_NOSPU|nr:hypothetical protein [Nostoc punctiforme]MBD2612979.1 hypothetical protein [Nostoc punctiforme FACHB-252]MDZ8012076.1 hypothetical protein [Nostoc sp. ZfuVER08]